MSMGEQRCAACGLSQVAISKTHRHAKAMRILRGVCVDVGLYPINTMKSVTRDIESPPGGWQYTVPETGLDH
jgi:hypothetical protein